MQKNRSTEQSIPREDKLKLNRRTFLKASSALAAAAAGGYFFKENPALASVPDTPQNDESVDVVYTVDLMCHSGCGLQCKVKDGVLIKVDGNPYHPNCKEYDERLPFDTPTSQAKSVRGRCCAKAQAAIETLYSPYRLKGPLKKVGARDSGQWQSISWDEAINEIVSKLQPLNDVNTLIDPNYPELGPVANKFLFSPGRFEHGQKEFTDRVFGNGLGTINKRHDHTSICEASRHVGYQLMLADVGGTDLKPDMMGGVEYILILGTNPLEACFPMIAYARKLMHFKRNGGKLVVADPRLSNTASKADKWLPIKPGGDLAFVMGMIQHLIANNLYDKTFLENANQAAAAADNEKMNTDATHLVKLDRPGGAPGELLRADEVFPTGGAGNNVAWVAGAPVEVGEAAQHGELGPGVVTVNLQAGGNVQCKTAFDILNDRANEHTLDFYAEQSGLAKSTIEETAAEIASFGKKAVADCYRGPVKHTNGTYQAMAILSLNLLLGNIHHKGGYAPGGGHYHGMGGKVAGQVSLKTVPGGKSATGIQLTRVKSEYETAAPNLFARDGYPAKRPWFPLAGHGNYQEVVPSIRDKYPYPIDVLMIYWNNWAYSTPGGKGVSQETLKDRNVVPYYVAFDTEMGETSSLADLLLPDSTFLERFSTPHVASTILTATSGFRHPVVGDFGVWTDPFGPNPSFQALRRASAPFDLNETNDYRPFLPNTRLIEDITAEIGKRLGFPGVGAGAFDLTGAADPGANPNIVPWSADLNNAWDWYKNALNNFALESGKSAQAIIDKGGVFEDGDGYTNGELSHAKSGLVSFYVEKLAKTKDSFDGQYLDAIAHYEEAMDNSRTLINDIDSICFPFQVVTYKPAIHAQARTANNPSLMMLLPSNFVDMNAADAAMLGVRTGDKVRITSRTNPAGVTGIVKATEGMRPGVIAVSHSYGHWEMSSRPWKLDGKTQNYDPSRATGTALGPVLRTDTSVDPSGVGVCLQDRIGGSASFYDTHVRVFKEAMLF